MVKKIASMAFIWCFILGSALFWSIPSEASWVRTYGGASPDYATSMARTSGGGYIVAGSTGNFGTVGTDCLVLKLDSDWNLEWQKTYGSSGVDVCSGIEQTEPDLGYIVTGTTSSFGAGGSDVWVLKLDGSGNVEWQKTYGGSGSDQGVSVKQTDSGYIVAAQTSSFGMGSTDVWLLKLDTGGNITWQRSYGGASADFPYDIAIVTGGGYIVAGQTLSFGAGGIDAWILKVDAEGNIVWQKTYGGTLTDWAGSIQKTVGGGYIVLGETSSFGAGDHDIWILKIDESGAIAWQKTYGGPARDEGDGASEIRQTSDQGYIVPGTTSSFGAGGQDAWLLKLDSDGNMTWQRSYGGAGSDWSFFVDETVDGGYIMTGITDSFGAGTEDIWLLKLEADGSIINCPFGEVTNATVMDTSVAGVTSTAEMTITAVTPADITIVPVDSTATSSEICPSIFSLLLLSPDGGEKLTTDSDWTVRWWMAPLLGASSFKVSYSLDNGSTWALIGKGITETSTTWTTPLLTKNKTKCLVKVAAFDDKGKKVGVDKSDEPFAIGVLTITDINGGNNCISGLTCPITWTLADTITPDQLQVSYTLDGGATWKKEQAVLIPAGSTYDWTAPSVNKDKRCKVKLTFKTSGKMVATATSGKFDITNP